MHSTQSARVNMRNVDGHRVRNATNTATERNHIRPRCLAPYVHYHRQTNRQTERNRGVIAEWRECPARIHTTPTYTYTDTQTTPITNFLRTTTNQQFTYRGKTNQIQINNNLHISAVLFVIYQRHSALARHCPRRTRLTQTDITTMRHINSKQIIGFSE